MDRHISYGQTHITWTDTYHMDRHISYGQTHIIWTDTYHMDRHISHGQTHIIWTDTYHMDKIKTLQYGTCVRNSGSSSLRSLHWISPALFMARVCLCQSFRLYESNLLFTLFSLFFSTCSLSSCKSAQSVQSAGHINKTVLNRN